MAEGCGERLRRASRGLKGFARTPEGEAFMSLLRSFCFVGEDLFQEGSERKSCYLMGRQSAALFVQGLLEAEEEEEE